MKRGAKVIVVDPRHNETAKVASEHHFIRPGSDLFFLLSFLHELFAQGGVDEAKAGRFLTGLDEVKNLCANWPAEKTAEVTGIASDRLKQIVSSYIAAGASAIVTGTGIGMGGRGTLAHWLAEVINAVSGNLDRQGGMLVGKGIADFVGYAKKNGLSERIKRSRIGNFSELNGGFPGGILADEILEPGQGQIKSLFVSGGNPLLTMANSARLREAFTRLELLVVIDIQLNETASLAHYVLPATSPLERADLPFIFPLLLGLQSKPYLAATSAIVQPDGEQRDEATIYTDLATAAGVGLFGSKLLQQAMRLMQWGNGVFGGGKGSLPVEFILDLILRQTGNGRFKAMCEKPDGVPLPQAAPGSYLGSRVLHEDGKVHLAPELLMAETTRLESFWQKELAAIAKGEMRLITKRYHHTHNSWTKNIPELISGEAGRTNYLYIHPVDAARLGLAENSVADIRTQTATIRLPVQYLDELMPGTVAVPHGWGHQGARGMTVASELGGANVNLLAADGLANIEPASGMVHLTAIPVEISPAAGPLDPKSWSGIGVSA
jgi:anaerobic selenocysteine-containing dehydrogenase